MKAYHHIEDGQTWLRIVTDTDEWDEPIQGWSIVIALDTGLLFYRHVDGKQIDSM